MGTFHLNALRRAALLHPLRSIVLGFSLLCVVIYGTSLGNDFVHFDDGSLVFLNPLVTEVSMRNIVRIFTSFDPELYTPLSLLSFQFDHVLSGTHPFFYHLTNLVLHTGNALLVTWFAWLLLGKNAERAWVAILCGTVFLVHPLNTEAAMWVSARKDLLATFFALLTFVGYLAWQESSHRKHYYGCIATMLLGLLSKVTIVTMPLVLLLFDYRKGRRINRQAVLEKLPFFGLSVLFGIVGLVGKPQAGDLASLSESLLLGARSTAFYLQKLLLPHGLSMLYPYGGVSLFAFPILVSLLLLIVLSIGAWKVRDTMRDVLFAWLFYLITLAPTFLNARRGLNGEDLYMASDRYAYLPGVALLFLACLMLERLWKRGRAMRSLLRYTVPLVLLILAFSASAQSRVWKNDKTLFQNVAEHRPNSYVAHEHLGIAFQNDGLLSTAIAHYRTSLDIRPTDRVYYNLGLAYLNQGLLELSMEANRKALQLNPAHAPAQLNMGVALLKKGLYDEAIDAFTKTAELDPLSGVPYVNIATIYREQGRNEEADVAMQKAMAIDPELLRSL